MQMYIVLYLLTPLRRPDSGLRSYVAISYRYTVSNTDRTPERVPSGNQQTRLSHPRTCDGLTTTVDSALHLHTHGRRSAHTRGSHCEQPAADTAQPAARGRASRESHVVQAGECSRVLSDQMRQSVRSTRASSELLTPRCANERSSICTLGASASHPFAHTHNPPP